MANVSHTEILKKKVSLLLSKRIIFLKKKALKLNTGKLAKTITNPVIFNRFSSHGTYQLLKFYSTPTNTIFGDLTKKKKYIQF